MTMQKNPDNEMYEEANQLIAHLMMENAAELDADTLTTIGHYLRHDEYEMAFEGLFIDLISLGKLTSSVELRKYVELGEGLNLNNETVFDVNFWERFLHFIKTQPIPADSDR